MKRIIFTALMVLLLVGHAFGAGTVTQSIKQIAKDVYIVTFICIGDSSNGSIPNTATKDNDDSTSKRVLNGKIRGLRLKEVKAYPTSGGTAPLASNVFIVDDDNLDLLGSEDGSTTAWAGLTLIHATLTRSAVPNRYLPRAGQHQNYWPPVDGVLTLKVTGQTTASADYTIELKFGK